MRAYLVVTLVALSSCQCAPEPLEIPEGCSPLGFGVDCGTPFPSDVFLVDDAKMPSGKRIQLGAAAKMFTPLGVSADVNESWQADGFSRVPPIVFAFGQEVKHDGLPGLFDDPARTVAKGWKTALIDADTGERVAHFIDVDPRALDAQWGDAEDEARPERQGLVMHPVLQLKETHRYIVAISGVAAAQGELTVPEGFRRIRDTVDGTDAIGADAVLAPLLEHFDAEVFPQIEKAGIARADLQLAWDFTTGSDARAMNDMLEARARALEWLDVNEPLVEIDTVFEGDSLVNFLDDDSGITWRFVKGFVTGPLFLDEDEAGSLLHRDSAGAIVVNDAEQARFAFSAVIPASVRDADEPARAFAFGHGFFGDRTELESGPVRRIANEAGVVAFAIDWAGMSDKDIGFVVQAIGGDVWRSLEFGDRVIQGMVNWQVLTRAIRSGALSSDPAFARPVRKGSAGARGRDVIDEASPLAFLGISQGHVLGGTLAALNADINRNILMVGGAAFTTMMFRARPFDRFLALLQFSLPDPLDQQKLAAMMQTHFDRFDPAQFAPYVVRKGLPLGPDNGHAQRKVLVQTGIGDTQVPNLGSALHVRLLGIPQLTPSPYPAQYGVEQLAYPNDGSGWAVFDLGVDDAFYEQAEPSKTGNIVHEGVRRAPEAIAQIKAFIADGVIENPCDGACVIDLSGINVPTG
jgi:hypothetical protein